MSNERLRSAILVDAGLTLQEFGERVGVDPKTVERWVSKDRVPHRTHRLKAASILGKTDVFLWPTTAADPQTKSATRAEFVDLYPSRGAVPSGTWTELIDNASESIDILAFAGSFLHDSIPEFAGRITARVNAGVRVRFLFGDPDSDAVIRRGIEEGIGDSMTARCNLTWRYIEPLIASTHGIEARKHGNTLYASVFRFDDTLLVNPHAYGAPAGHSPIMHIQRIPGGRLFTHYMESLERTWQQAQPV
ncbi:MAG: XRE family transcriptional regulator [Ornithinimicrobium sp.]